MPPQKPKKQLVLKEKYLAYLGEKVGLTVLGTCVVIFALFLITMSTLSFMTLVMSDENRQESLTLVILSVGAIIAVCVAYYGKSLIKDARSLQPLSPITRYNTAQLPAVESLVRPSSVPSLPQEHFLLHPTVATEETHADELLRPHSIELN